MEGRPREDLWGLRQMVEREELQEVAARAEVRHF